MKNPLGIFEFRCFLEKTDGDALARLDFLVKLKEYKASSGTYMTEGFGGLPTVWTQLLEIADIRQLQAKLLYTDFFAPEDDPLYLSAHHDSTFMPIAEKLTTPDSPGTDAGMIY